MGSIPPPLNVTNLTISKFHHALTTGTTTCTELVTTYLTRINTYDPTLKSIIHINRTALETAHQKDCETQSLLQANKPLPPLHGIPLILKDNITTHDTPTSAGVKALHSLTTTSDSPLVSRLRDAGAIILAKANLHELALQGTTTSSVRGQTLNPWDYTRTPGGSSGGTAVAVSCGLGLVGCGSDTVNSCRSPASACGVVGFRPSVGRVCTKGVVPVSKLQDVVGPIGGCVRDVRVVFDVMKSVEREESRDDGGGRSIRIGILDAYFGLDDSPEDQDLAEDIIRENGIVQDIINKALTSIANNAGSDIELILINPTTHPDWRFANLSSTTDTQLYEFQQRLDTFLQSPGVISPYSSLKEIAASGEYDREAVTKVFTAPLKDPKTYSLDSAGYAARLEKISVLKESVRKVFEENGIDALVYPHQRQFVAKIGTSVQPRRNGILAALTGRPAICIPAGLSPPTASAVHGVPVGLELMGRVDCDEALLDLAERIEGIFQQRKVPDLTWIEEGI